MTVTDEGTSFARNLWAMLAEEGVWGVPRSGLMYRKKNGQLVLYARMPHHPQLPMTPLELHEQQDSDHAEIRVMFSTIGVEVVEDLEQV